MPALEPIADFFAIIAALRLAERRVRENIAARFGVDTLIFLRCAEMLERNKSRHVARSSR